jgi:hypothetical protein
MSLITEHIRKNADKCKECAIIRVRSIDKSSVLKEMGKALDLYDEASIAMEAVIRTSCNSCPNVGDFVKVYGMKPYEYFIVEKQK